MTLTEILAKADEVLALDEKATPGPWRVNPDFPYREESGKIHPTEAQAAIFSPRTIDFGFGHGPEPEEVVGSCWYDGPHTLVKVVDAEAIASYRTAAPDLARALKAVAEALEEIYAEANRQLLTMQSDSAESRDVLLWNERGLAVEDIRAAIERRLTEGK